MIEYEEVKNKLGELGIEVKEIEEKYKQFREEIKNEFEGIDEEGINIKATRRLLKYYRKVLSRIMEADDIEGVIIGFVSITDFNKIAKLKSIDGTYPEGWLRAGEPIPDEPNYNLTYLVWDGRAINQLKLGNEVAKNYAENPTELLNRKFKGKAYVKDLGGVLQYNAVMVKIGGKDESIWNKISSIPVYEAKEKGIDSIVVIHGDVQRVNITKNNNFIVELVESFEDRQKIDGEKIVGFSKWVKIPDTEERVKVIGRVFENNGEKWVEIYGANKFVEKKEKIEYEEEVEI